jgi:transcriptional regulator with XRE-family HTH domain
MTVRGSTRPRRKKLGTRFAIAAGSRDHLIGLQVKAGRLLADGMSQDELGRRLPIPVSRQQIGKYETGKDRITAARLGEIAEVLGIPIEFFFRNAIDHRRIDARRIEQRRVVARTDSSDLIGMDSAAMSAGHRRAQPNRPAKGA